MSTTVINLYPPVEGAEAALAIANQIKVYDPGAPGVDLVIDLWNHNANHRLAAALSKDEAATLVNAITREAHLPNLKVELASILVDHVRNNTSAADLASAIYELARDHGVLDIVRTSLPRKEPQFR